MAIAHQFREIGNLIESHKSLKRVAARALTSSDGSAWGGNEEGVCSLPPWAMPELAVRMHWADPRAANLTSPTRLNYLQVTYPLPPKVPGVTKMAAARVLMAPLLREPCTQAAEGRFLYPVHRKCKL